MTIPNAILGIDHDSANGILAELYTALTTTGPLTQSFPLNQVGITTANVEIHQAPTVEFKDAALVPAAVEHIKSTVVNHEAVKKLAVEKQTALAHQAVTLIGQSAFTIFLPAVTLTISYKPDSSGKPQPTTTIKGSLSAALSTAINPAPFPPELNVQAIWGKIQTDEAELMAIANEGIIPYACGLIDDALKPFKLQTLSPIANFDISTPEPVVQDGELVAFSALGRSPPGIPAPYKSWPKGLFAAADAALIATAANDYIPTVHLPSKSFGWKGLGGGYDLHLGQLQNVSIHQDNSGNLTASVSATAHADIGFTPPKGLKLPSITIGASITGNITVTGNAHVQGSELFINIQDAQHVGFVCALDGVPNWVNDLFFWVIDGLADFLINLIAPAVCDILRLFQIPIYKLPKVHAPIGNGLDFYVVMTNFKAVGLNPSGSDPMLVVYGVPGISKTG